MNTRCNFANRSTAVAYALALAFVVTCLGFASPAQAAPKKPKCKTDRMTDVKTCNYGNNNNWNGAFQLVTETGGTSGGRMFFLITLMGREALYEKSLTIRIPGEEAQALQADHVIGPIYISGLGWYGQMYVPVNRELLERIAAASGPTITDRKDLGISGDIKPEHAAAWLAVLDTYPQ